MYESILVPTDGSIHAEAAAERAFELGRTVGAGVHIIAVVDPGPFGSIRLPGDRATAKEIFTEEAEENISRLAERAQAAELEPITEIREGTPVGQILEYVDAHEIDLIVMGSRGRGGIDRMVIGSVTEGVTRYGSVDVLVIGEP